MTWPSTEETAILVGERCNWCCVEIFVGDGRGIWNEWTDLRWSSLSTVKINRRIQRRQDMFFFQNVEKYRACLLLKQRWNNRSILFCTIWMNQSLTLFWVLEFFSTATRASFEKRHCRDPTNATYVKYCTTKYHRRIYVGNSTKLRPHQANRSTKKTTTMMRCSIFLLLSS